MKLNKRLRDLILLLGAMFLCLGTCNYFRYNELKVNGCYTVGEVTGIKIGTKGKRHLRYKFKIGDSFWYGQYGEIGHAKKGHKYLVLYSKADYSLNMIYPDRPVDSLELGTELGRYRDSPMPMNIWKLNFVFNNSPD